MYKVISQPTTEPLSLAAVKLHLRLTSDTLAGDMAMYQSIVPGSHIVASSYGLVGASIDVLGNTALVNLNAGLCGVGGSVAAKIQESDDNTAWQDFTGGGFTTVIEANDNAVQEIGYTGTKQYIRVVATVAIAACSFSADVIVMTGDVDEDSWLSDKITAAREYCENHCGQAFATQTIEFYKYAFPRAGFQLPKGPVQSITSIKYKDCMGVETVLANTNYIVDTDSDIGGVVLAYGKAWPSFTPYPLNPIKVTYVAGMTDVPKSIKQAMLLLIGGWYENRESALVGTIASTVDFSVKSLLSQYKYRWW